MATAKDAELILKLYELRTEPLMRESRAFVASFNPTTAEEMLTVVRGAGTKENAAWRQVMSFWEMAATFVLQDALDPELFAETSSENFYFYAKFTPFFDRFSEATGHPFMPKLGKLIEMYPAMQERYMMMLAVLEARKKQTQAV